MSPPRSGTVLRVAAALLACLLIGAVGLVGQAQAAMYTVGNTGDPTGACALTATTCSLRQLINDENALNPAPNPADTIVVPSGIYSLTQGQLLVRQSLTIAGAGAETTQIDQEDTQATARVFEIMGNAKINPDPTVVISGVAMAFGKADSTNGSQGGDVQNQANLTLSEDLIEDGTASGTGGGVSNDGGTLTITHSLVWQNSSVTVIGATVTGGIAGGVENYGDTTVGAGTLSIDNSTIADNTAAELGGGVVNRCAGTNSACSSTAGVKATTTIKDSTIADNNGGSGGVTGGGLLASQGTISIGSSIVALNTVTNPTTGGQTPSNCGAGPAGVPNPGVLNSLGYNLETATDCGFTSTGDIQSTNPQFFNGGGLAFNGGNTETFALSMTSPAVDAIPKSVTGCSGTDQRDIPRPQGSRCDIGAYELFEPVEGSQFTTVLGRIGATSATIDWADGSRLTSATVDSLGNVIGTHTYVEEGNYSGLIDWTNSDGAAQSTPFDLKVQDAPLTASAVNFTAVAGEQFSGPVATFTDANPNAPVSDYTATIVWGDGNQSTGTVTAGPSGGFVVSGTHTYVKTGSYQTTVSIADVGGSTAVVLGTATVDPPAPTVTQVSPSAGPTAGGTAVTITGTNLTGATAVSFGSTPATSFTVTSSTQISATAPAGAGIVDVTVTTAVGTSTTSAADRYAYGGCTDEFSPQSGNDWGTAANWSEGTVPTSSDVACWPVGTDVTVSSSDSSATAMSVEGGDLTITGGSLSLAGPAGSTLVDLAETGGALNGPGSLAFSGNFSWTGGLISQSEPIAITQPAGQTFSITGTNQAYLVGGSISTGSPVTISNTSFIAVGGPTLTTTSTVTFAPGSYQNNGANLTITAAGFITTGATNIPDYNLDLDGTTSSLGGSLTVPSLSSTSGSSLTVPSGSNVTVTGGTIDGTITGAGTYTQAGGTNTIASGATLTTNAVTITSGTLTVNSGADYAAAGATTINGGTLNIAPNSASTGSLTETAGGLNGPGSLALSGNFSWTGGLISQSEPIAITQPAGQTFSITGTDQAYLVGGSISTQSPVTISNTSFIAVGGPTLTTTSTVTFAPGSYQNNGANLTITAAGFITTGATNIPDYNLDLDGTTSSLGGSLTVPSLSSTSGSSLTVPSGSNVTVTGGTIDGTITGAGTYTQAGGTNTIASGATLTTNAVTITSGTLTVNSGADYAAAGATTINGGTLNIAPNSASTGSLTETAGGLNGPGSLALSGNFSWTGGLISQSEPIAITQPAGQTFSITGTNQAYLVGGSISTESPVTISNTDFIAVGGPTLTTTSTVTFTPGSYTANGGASLTISAAGFDTTGNTTLPNYSLVQTGGTTTVASGITLASGPLTVQGGVVQDDGTVEATTTITGGTLTGAGVVEGSLTNTSGTVTPGDSPSPGTLNVTASYSQGSAGTLQIAINGTTAGQHSLLNVGGDVALDGTLAVVPSASYASSAQPGDRIAFLPYAALRTGEFASTTVNPALADGATISPDYSTAANIYAVVGNPPPPTVTGLQPTTGPAGGGTTVTITGTGFTGASAVDFGAHAASSFAVNSATSITATAPAGSGTVDVTVTTPGGTSATGTADEYSYTPVPTVAQVAPAAGPTGGGTSVTITGTGLTGATAVEFGSTAAANVTVVSASQITATAPAGTAGTVDITVTSPGGTSATSNADQYTYTAAPTVAQIAPTAGPTGGGTSVTITGTNLTGATAVKFGSTAATSFTINGATSISAVAPAESAGTVNITVTTPGGISATSAADQYTYTAAPTVTQIAPTAGPLGGGTTVTITGTNLTGATAVNFGSTSATSFTVNSATSITAFDPAHSAGTVDVTVTTPGGTSATSAADRYTYTTGPTVTSIAPTAGPLGGATSVTITGANLTGATAVKFGTTSATSFTVNSANSITATTPAESAGTVDITVTSPGGTSATSTADQYTYFAAPAVTSVNPTAGPTAGGNSVTITGTNLTGATAVSFGSNAATNVTVVSASQITATPPAGSAGTVDVTVTTPGGTSATSAADRYTYTTGPTVTSIAPTAGPLGGATSVTITGANLTGATAVKFGTTSATSFTVNSANSITATAPAESAGTVDITVTSPGGTSATSAADRYTYFALPTVTSVNPIAGPTAGATSVTVTGTNLTGATAVKFGSTAATNLTINSPTSITATAPAESAGTVDITVTTPGGTSATSTADRYTYAAAPTVTSINPTSGPTAGGNSVTITGTNLAGATAVSFGSTTATSFTVNGATSITALDPAQSAGTVDVTVTTPGGTSGTSAADRFTYNAPQPSSPPPASPPSTPPLVSGGSPTTETSGGAALSGSVNPEGTPTQAYFEYGLDLSQRGPGSSTALYDQSTAPQTVGSDSSIHYVSADLANLVPGGLYHVRLVAFNGAGTTLGADQTFTTAAAAAPPAPVLGTSENATPVTGTVFIKSPSGAFVPLTGAIQIRTGTEIDALKGSLELVASVGKHKTEHGIFGGAIFRLSQTGRGALKGLTTLTLVEGAFSGGPSFGLCKPHKALDATAASSKTLQLLHASAHGKFRTKGRYSAATVLGTKWTIADLCNGTLVHDITDSVAVNDFVHHKTIVLHAGQSYLAKAKP